MSRSSSQEGLQEASESIDRFIQYCESERQFSSQTIRAYKKDLIQAQEFLGTIGIGPLEEINDNEVGQYLAWLRKNDLSENTIERRIATLRSFFSFLTNKDLRKDNPVTGITIKNQGRDLPTVWSEQEIEEFIEQAPLGSRDRALFEILYSTGMRVSEATGLSLSDYDQHRSEMTVLGKGDKQRVVPVGPPAHRALQQYFQTRDCDSEDPMFTNSRGNPLTPRGVRYIVDQYERELQPKKTISPHVFRHSCATHMLNQGANLKTVQALLGHTNMSTTQIYTHVSTDRLKEVYDEAHPRAYRKND